MVDLFLKVLTQGIDEFIKNGASYFRYSIAISTIMAFLFSTLTYYFPSFWNKTYRNTKLCGLFAFFSFILTAITTFIICSLIFINTNFVEQLNEQTGFSIRQIKQIKQTILSTSLSYLLLQGALLAFLAIAAYRNIKVFR